MADTTTLTLTEFLLARIAEDEERARDAAGWDHTGRERANGRWHRTGTSSIEDDDSQSVIYSDNNQLSGTVADYIARHAPVRVLAECEAKRQIVERHEFERGRRDAYRSPRSREIEDERAAQDRRTQEARSRVAEDVLRLLALPYADHPDYRDEWRP